MIEHVKHRCNAKIIHTAVTFLAEGFTISAILYGTYAFLYWFAFAFEHREIVDTFLFRSFGNYVIKPFAELLYPEMMVDCVMLWAFGRAAQDLALWFLSLALLFFGCKFAFMSLKITR